MRIRTLVGASAAILLVLGAAAAPSEAARAGKIVVSKSITLSFPKPGTYVGVVKTGKPKIKVVPRTFKGKPGKAEQRKAVRMAGRKMPESGLDDQGQRDPPLQAAFTIGEDKPRPIPRSGAQYAVSGNEPPTGDKVQALQNAARRFLSSKKFFWVIVCRRATVIRPYPF